MMRSTGPERTPQEFRRTDSRSHECSSVGPAQTVAAWHDLLGFAAALDSTGWRLSGPPVDLLVRRLQVLCMRLRDSETSGHEYLILNDGVIDTFSPDIFGGAIGSRHDLLSWFHSRLKVHCITTGLEKDFQLPGLRTIICQGEVLVHDVRIDGKPFKPHDPNISPLSTQFNTALTKCYLADDAGSSAGLKKGGVYVEQSFIDALIQSFGCKVYEEGFLFLYGEPLISPASRYRELSDYFQLPEDQWKPTGIFHDRSTWLELGDSVEIVHKSLRIELREVKTYSPYDECALFWFDTLTGDMHGINDASVTVVDDEGNPRYKQRQFTESELVLLEEYTSALKDFVEKNHCFPQNRGVKEEPSEEVVTVDLGSRHLDFRQTESGLFVPTKVDQSPRFAPSSEHPWATTLLAGRRLREAVERGLIRVGTQVTRPRDGEVDSAGSR